MSKDFKAMLAGARLPERTVPVCLRGDLVAEFEELDRALAEAQLAGGSADSKEGGPAHTIAAQMEALREQMADETYPFRLRALSRPEYHDLKAKFPPRQNDEGEVQAEDVLLDANLDEFAEPLLRACLVDPVLDDAGWTETLAKLSSRQYDELANVAIRVNRGGVDIPFSRAASNLLQSSSDE
jgi:hypothetical protein